MKKTRNLFVLKGNSKDTLSLLNQLRFKGMDNFNMSNISKKDIFKSFSNNKSVLCCCSLPKEFKRSGIYIGVVNNPDCITDYSNKIILNSEESPISQFEKIADMIENMQGITVLKKKDYVTTPKENGYSSYHMIVSVPVSLSVGTIDVKVEIQIRTMAMDFWASLEHKINYKYDKQVPKAVRKELRDCAKMTHKLDKRMSHLGRNLMEEEKQAIKEITTEYTTVYTTALLSENAGI